MKPFLFDGVFGMMSTQQRPSQPTYMYFAIICCFLCVYL